MEGSFNPIENISETTTSSLLDTREPHWNERIVKAPDQFTFLGETISDELDLDPSSYNEAIFDKNSKNWQSAVKVKMESIYSNHVLKLVELPVNVKPIGFKWVY